MKIISLMKAISLIVVLVICVIVFREKPLEDPLLLMPDRETTGTSASPTATCDITGGTIDGVTIGAADRKYLDSLEYYLSREASKKLLKE